MPDLKFTLASASVQELFVAIAERGRGAMLVFEDDRAPAGVIRPQILVRGSWAHAYGLLAQGQMVAQMKMAGELASAEDMGQHEPDPDDAQ